MIKTGKILLKEKIITFYSFDILYKYINDLKSNVLFVI